MTDATVTTSKPRTTRPALNLSAFLHAFAATIDPASDVVTIDGRHRELVHLPAEHSVCRVAKSVHTDCLAALYPGFLAINGLPVVLMRDGETEPLKDAARDAWSIGRAEPNAALLSVPALDRGAADAYMGAIRSTIDGLRTAVDQAARWVRSDNREPPHRDIASKLGDVLRLGGITYSIKSARAKLYGAGERAAARKVANDARKLMSRAIRECVPAWLYAQYKGGTLAKVPNELMAAMCARHVARRFDSRRVVEFSLYELTRANSNDLRVIAYGAPGGLARIDALIVDEVAGHETRCREYAEREAKANARALETMRSAGGWIEADRETVWRAAKLCGVGDPQNVAYLVAKMQEIRDGAERVRSGSIYGLTITRRADEVCEEYARAAELIATTLPADWPVRAYDPADDIATVCAHIEESERRKAEEQRQADLALVAEWRDSKVDTYSHSIRALYSTCGRLGGVPAGIDFNAILDATAERIAAEGRDCTNAERFREITTSLYAISTWSTGDEPAGVVERRRALRASVLESQRDRINVIVASLPDEPTDEGIETYLSANVSGWVAYLSAQGFNVDGPEKRKAYSLASAERAKARDAQRIAAERAELARRFDDGERGEFHAIEPTRLRAIDGKARVETSRGARVSYSGARHLWRQWRNGTTIPIGSRVGDFVINAVTDTEIRIGCHILTRAECDRFAASEGWVAELRADTE